MSKNTKFIDSIFEILAAKTTEIFFIDLYDKARQHMADGSFVSVTEAYTHIIKRYAQAANNTQSPDFLRSLCRAYYNYYCVHTGKISADYSMFEDTVVSALVPEEHFNILTQTNKTKLLADCINHIINDFAIRVIHEFKPMIIDQRKDQDVVRVLQDSVKEILYNKREDYLNALAKQVAASKHDSSDKLRASLRSETQQNLTLKKENAKLLSIINAMTTRIKKLQATKCSACDEARNKSVKLMASNAELERELRSSSASLGDMRSQLITANNKYSELDAERARLIRECDQLRNQISQQDRVIADLRLLATEANNKPVMNVEINRHDDRVSTPPAPVKKIDEPSEQKNDTSIFDDADVIISPVLGGGPEGMVDDFFSSS